MYIFVHQISPPIKLTAVSSLKHVYTQYMYTVRKYYNLFVQALETSRKVSLFTTNRSGSSCIGC
jgi:hypothetical protein